EPVRLEPLDQIVRLVADRRGPDVRSASEAREQHQRLRQAAVEGIGIGRTAQALEAVEERIELGRIRDEDRVAQVTQLATRQGVYLGLVEQQSSHRRAVHVADPGASPGRLGRHGLTIARRGRRSAYARWDTTRRCEWLGTRSRSSR